MQGALVGSMRNVESLKGRRAPAYGAKNEWHYHIEGALGEMAVAKALSVYWGGTVCSFHSADIGEQLQVRTRSSHTYDLIVRDADDDDHIFLLVTGEAPTYHVRGWMRGRDAKRDEFLKEYGGRPPAYFVPQSELHTLEALGTLEPVA